MISRRRAEGFLLLSTFIWGATFAITQSALSDASPMLFVGLRFVLASLVAMPFLLRRGAGLSAVAESGAVSAEGVAADAATSGPVLPAQTERLWGPFTRREWVWGLLVGLAMLAGYAGQTIGLKYTTVARSGFLSYFFALVVPFLQFLFFRQKPGWGNFLGLLVVIWGFSFIVDPAPGPLSPGELSPRRIFDMAHNIASGGLNRGDMFTLAGAVGYAFYIVFIDRANRKCRSKVIIFFQLAFCGVASLLIAPFVEPLVLVVSWKLAGALLYLSVLGSVLALGLINWFQRYITPLRAVLIYSTEPVFAAVFGWLILKSGMSVREVVGAALIVGGILVSDAWGIMIIRRMRRKKRRALRLAHSGEVPEK